MTQHRVPEKSVKCQDWRICLQIIIPRVTKIQVTRATYEILQDKFLFVGRGAIAVGIE
ncbi:MAG: hypothetical protein GDA56_32865 [Hormoscilla sp. GM7CHS1pb]|nr:hypothetical protein [Hormoscilla sp. GM7CHS1pb]